MQRIRRRGGGEGITEYKIRIRCYTTHVTPIGGRQPFFTMKKIPLFFMFVGEKKSKKERAFFTHP